MDAALPSQNMPAMGPSSAPVAAEGSRRQALGRSFPRRFTPLFSTALFILGLTFLQSQIIDRLNQAFNQLEIDGAAGILAGHPAWQAFQNRVLGPASVALFAKITHLPFAYCYHGFGFLALVVANSICFYLFAVRPERFYAGAATVLYALLVIVYQDERWIYLWDYIDLSVMLLFAWSILNGGSLWQLLALFTVELFNRESVQFIALWIALSAVSVDTNEGRRHLRIDGRRLAVGVTLMAVAYGGVYFLRHAWYVSEVGDSHGAYGLQELADGQHFVFRRNLRRVSEAPGTTLVEITILLGSIFCLLGATWNRRSWQVATFLLAFIVVNLLFANLIEMRIWFTLLPFLLCLLDQLHEASRVQKRVGSAHPL